MKKSSELKTDFFSEDDEAFVTCAQTYFDTCVLNPPVDSGSTTDDLDISRSSPYFSQLPPTPLVKKTTESPERKNKVSTLGCVLFWSCFISAVLVVCVNMQMATLKLEKNLQTFPKPATLSSESRAKDVKKSLHANIKSPQKRFFKNDGHHYSMLMPSKNIDIPIFLDLPGTNTFAFTENLSKCLGLKGATVYKNDFEKVMSSY